MDNKYYKTIEFLVIYVLVPMSFIFNYPFWAKMAIGLIGFAYVVYVLLQVENNKFKISENLKWVAFWKQTFVKFLSMALLTILFVYFTNKAILFHYVINKPLLWLFFIIVYAFLSVYPQELVYRTFYFQRYKGLFKNNQIFVFINAVAFSLGHIFFKNGLVIVLTFLGGLLFAITYNKTQSTLLVSIEHAIYGSWLFTVGMGSMLGFPN